MIIGSILENQKFEKRITITPEIVKKYISIGLDVCLSILQVMHEGFKNSKYAPSALLVNMVKSGKLGVKSGEGFYDYSESKKAELVAKQFQ